MKSNCRYYLAAVAVASLAAVGAQAQISGSLWEVGSDAIAGNAVLASIPARSADVTFSVPGPGLDFNSDNAANGYTVGGFLATGGATGVSYNNGTAAADSDDDTLIELTGKVTMTMGQTYNTEHDDGLTLTIDGFDVVNAPGPTAATFTPYTWTQPSGTYDFTLVYGECCGPPAVLLTTLPLVNAPDSGSTMALLGGALTLVGTVARRFRK